MKKVEAIELFSSAICNLNCKYCYIPKDKVKMSQVHNLIIEKIKNGRFISQIKDLVGDDLTSISHWGTEPTLTLSMFKKFYTDILNEFPKFKTVSMSSNFMTDPNILINFINDFPKTDRQIKFKIQISLDGPAWITDYNRVNGSAETIVKNTIEFVKNVKVPDNYFVELGFKPTHDANVISDLSNKFLNFLSYCEFFDNVIYEVSSNINNKSIFLNRNCQPTVVVPGQYTKQDGLNYSKVAHYFSEVFQERKYKNAIFPLPYYTHFCRMIKRMDLSMVGRTSIGCSAGNSMLAFDHQDGIHICHRLFYEGDEFKNSINEFFRNSNSYLGYNDGTDKNELFKSLSTNCNDKLNLSRVMYLTKGLNDYHKFKIGSGFTLIKELSLCGLISEEYSKDDLLCTLLMLFMISRDCYIDSLLGAGSIHLTCPSVLKLFGNGVFELLYHNMIGEHNV